MGLLLPFPDLVEKTAASAVRKRRKKHRGEVLLFTGVRIERHASKEEMQAVRLQFQCDVSANEDRLFKA
ncbi:MAG: hypothetical protein AAFO79_02110 [Pseudomonadota bacterium]